MRLLRLFVRGLWDIGRVALVYTVGLLALVGLCVVSDAASPPQLPTIRALTDTGRREVELWRVGPTQRADSLPMSAEQRWGRLRGALCILDRVSPEIADWTRDRWVSGHLVFEEARRGRYAAWNVGLRVLIVNLVALEESDVELACTLAHEFRHSRQNLLCSVRAILSRMAGCNRTGEFVEDEAYEFEARVRRAISGGW